MSEKNSRFEVLVKEEERLIIEEIENEVGKMRNDNGIFDIFEMSMSPNREKIRNAVNFLIDKLAKCRARQYIREKASKLSE